MKKLSIIVPVYNVDRYLSECIDSLLDQDYPNFEIILIDDGSTDESGCICDDYANKFNGRVFTYHKSNGGLPSARNFGLDKAGGAYISFIDSDDAVDKSMFVELVKSLEASSSQLAGCNYILFDKKGAHKVPNFIDKTYEYEMSSLSFYRLALGGCTNKIFLKSIIDKYNIRFESKEIVPQEDYYFQIKYFTHIDRVNTISKYLYYYRQRASSITKTDQAHGFAEKVFSLVPLSKDYINKYSDRNPSLFYAYENAVMGFSVINHSTIISVTEIISILKRMNLGNENNCFALRKALFPNISLQHLYFRSLLKLLRIRFYHLVAILEKIRISRLKKIVFSQGDMYE